MSENLTIAQKQAIEWDKGNIIVSASAGSGKTFVVIERIIRLILEKNVDVENILAVTFTKLAADEIKEKLKNAIIRKYNETGNEVLKNQYEKIPYSSISTIHSFCADLLRKYFYAINLDANFVVIDKTLADKLLLDVISDVFDELYERNDEDFIELLKIFYRNRKDDSLQQTIKSLLEKLRSESDFENFSQKTESSYLNLESHIQKSIIENNKPQLKNILSKVESVYDAISISATNKKIIDVIKNWLEDAINGNVRNDVEFSKIRKNNKDTSVEQTTLNSIIDDFKEIYQVYNNQIYSKEYIELSKTYGLKSVTSLYKIINIVNERYAKVKREENGVDFLDLEHFSLKLLRIEEIRKEVVEKYSYIFIDEYQDVNGVQEELINLLNNDNEFMVGDSKQSIYAFRGCNLKYFIYKNDLYKNGAGKSLSLDNNFRSAENIITCVNNVFSRIMTKDFGGTDYKNNKMIYGGNYSSYKGVAEINTYKKEQIIEDTFKGIYSVINASERKNKQVYDSGDLAVVELIKNALEKEYYDIKEPLEKDRIKHFRFKDIAILMSSTKNQGERLAKVLQDFSIPVSLEGKDDISAYSEVKVLLDLVNFLKCFKQDVPLASTMINFGNFTENELFEIRKANRKENYFYNAVEKYSKCDNYLGNKVKNFIEYFDKMRYLAEFYGIGEILNKIIRETEWNIKLLSSSLGEEKLKRVNCVIAESTKSQKKMTAFEFYDYITKAISNIKISTVSGDDTVKIMTIHASKGLEYPYVIVAGLDKKINFEELKDSVSFSRDIGIATKIFKPDEMVSYDNPVKELIKEQIKRESIFEEIRKFYVALTRAKCELHILVDSENLKDNTDNLFKFNVTKEADFIQTSDAPVKEISLKDENKKEAEGKIVSGKEVNKDLIKEIKENLTYVYPHLTDTTLKVKASVSSIKDEEEYFEKTTLFGESNDAIGTAYHKFLELCDFYGDTASEQLKSFIDNGLIDKELYSLLEISKLNAILKMGIFKEIQGYSLFKEQKFCALVSGNKINLSTSDTKVLVQGIIDLLAVKDGEGILIDYKYSTIKNGEDLIKRYKNQLSLYKYAIESNLDIKISKVYLVNILQEKVVEIV